MLSFLKKHPFAVEAFFKSSIVFTFAVPKEQLQPLVPPCLALDTFKNELAFIAIAMVNTAQLRPKGFPVFMGNDFYLIGYRIFVRYKTGAGKRLRGLYILKSETNRRSMQVLGSIFTQYNYTTTDIAQTIQGDIIQVKSLQSGFEVTINTNDQIARLPATSPFSNWQEARRFAGPLPFTFDYNNNTGEVLMVEGVRQNWIPQPVSVIEYNFSYLNQLKLSNAVLASAFIINNIPYWWKKGKVEKWQG